MAAGVGLGG